MSKTNKKNINCYSNCEERKEKTNMNFWSHLNFYWKDVKKWIISEKNSN